MNNLIPYASRYMPEEIPSVDENGIVTDQKMVDHMMRSAQITRTQALIVLNCYYQTIQTNLFANGQVRFKDLFTLNLVAEHAKPVKIINTTNGVERRYKARGPSVKLRPVTSEGFVKMVVAEKGLKKEIPDEDKVSKDVAKSSELEPSI